MQNESSWETSRQMSTAAAALEVAETFYRRVQEEAKALQLKAPISGYVLTPDVHASIGKYILELGAIMRIGTRDSLRLVIPLT